eukprot:6010468-Amphidinium_carterae.1
MVSQTVWEGWRELYDSVRKAPPCDAVVGDGLSDANTFAVMVVHCARPCRPAVPITSGTSAVHQQLSVKALRDGENASCLGGMRHPHAALLKLPMLVDCGRKVAKSLMQAVDSHWDLVHAVRNLESSEFAGSAWP